MKTKNAIIYKILFLGLIVILAAAPFNLEGKKNAKGIVFDDSNQNGILDKGENGIPGVVVSNQYDVTQTDEKGYFHLPIRKETIIFVTKPTDYDIPLDDNNFPQFYYIHQPNGSPAGLKYKGIPPTGKLPRSIDFPLIKGKTGDSFDVIVTGDPQTAAPEELAYFRDDVVAGLIGTNARFYLALGDIMYDDLSLFDKMNRLVGKIGIPVYHVMGNHDMNSRVPDNKYEAETFKRLHGPDYYSFNYGKVHFVVLNSVKYKGWDKEKNKKGSYIGYIHERQLTWLKNDLTFVPEDYLVVLAMHIPVLSEMYGDERNMIVNRDALFKVLENRKYLLALAGHMHYVEYLEFNEKTGWNGKAPFPSLTAGAGCGTWWHGLKDTRGIPLGICTDGTPNGHFLFTFTGNRFNYRFCAPDASPYKQMRINSPTGTLSLQDLEDRKVTINVNVFAGTPHTVVTCELDNGPGTTMKRAIMKDPLFTRVINENPDKYKKWMKPTLCPHIWTAPLPGGLKPGIHHLKVTAKDRQGNVFTAHRLFEVNQEAEKLERVEAGKLGS